LVGTQSVGIAITGDPNRDPACFLQNRQIEIIYKEREYIMKKLMQIALILVLIAGLFQFIAAEPTASTIGSSATVSANFGSNTSIENTQMAACLIRIKGVICVIPNVGWNT
jgi:hypothetical protein